MYLDSFTLNGVEYTNTSEIENKVTLSDGNDYYLIEIELPSAAAAKDIVLAAKLTSGTKDFNGTFTMSIPKYAKKVIDLESSKDVEKTLVKDVLAYIRAAYVYFDSSDKDAVVAQIDGILGEYNNEFIKVDGEADTEKGLYAAKFILAKNPIIRFYLAEGKTKESYTFKYGNTTLKYVGEGSEEFDGVTYNYVDVSVYAYQLIGEITYTDGTDTGKYHINSYVDYVTSSDEYKTDVNLIVLVEKLYNYAKSSAAYRAYVLENS